MNTSIIIDGAKYKGCASIGFGASADMTDRTLENGDIAQDHINKQPITLNLDLTFYSTVFDSEDVVGSSHKASGEAINSGKFNRLDQYLYIMDLWDNKMMFDVECDLGYFESMVVTSIKVTENNKSSSSFEAAVELKEFNIVEFEAAVFQYITDADGKLVGVAPLGVYDKVTLKKPPKASENKDWMEQAHDWAAGWTEDHIDPYWQLGKVWNWMFG